jgi:arginine decarboxylase
MIQRSMKRLPLRALVVDDELGAQTAAGRAARSLVEELKGRALEVVEANSAEDGTSVITSDSAIHVILIDWSLGHEHAHDRSRDFLQFVRTRNDKIPIFLMAERGEATAIPVDVMEMVDEFIWTLEDTAAFVGGRVVAAARRYLEVLLPPLAKALMKLTQEYEYSWHTPGHAGGTAFLKSPVGRIFFDYFGENLWSPAIRLRSATATATSPSSIAS